MTVNGIEAHHRPPVPCPRKDLGLTPIGGSDGQERTRTPEQIRESENAILAKAHSQAVAVLVEENPTIKKLASLADRSYRKAEATLEKVEKFINIASAAEARLKHQQVLDLHANDGAEDRRRRPTWALWALWPTIIFSSVFEAIYLGENFRELLDIGEGQTFLYWAAYLPAIVLMVALMLAGTMLAQALFRRRSRTERRLLLPELMKRLVLPQTREPGDLPWPSWVLPVAFTAAVFSVLTAWALIRAYLATANGGRLQDYELYAAATLVLLAVAVVVLKIVTYNPYAYSANDAERLLKRADKRSTRLVDKVRTHVSRHQEHWMGLNIGISAVEAKAQRVINDAVIRVLEVRSNAEQPVVTELSPPELDTGALKYAYDVETRCHPDKLNEKLARQAEAVTEQFRAQQQQQQQQP